MDEETINIRDYFDVVLKRRWVIIACFVIVCVTVAIGTFMTRPVYKSTVRISIERENPNVVGFEEVLQLDASQSDYLLSQVDILQSRSLANNVILSMNLEESPEFKIPEEQEDPGWLASAKEWLTSLKESVTDFIRGLFIKTDKTAGKIREEGIYSPLVGTYLQRLSVEPVRRTRLLDISFEGYNPGLVAEIANSHVQAYIDKNLELKFQAAQDAIVWLNQKLVGVKEKLKESEDALQRFKEQEDIVSLGDIVTLNTSGDSIIHQKVSELNSALTAARIERINLETTRNALKDIKGSRNLIESFPKVIDNNLVNDLKSSLAATLRKKSELQEKYGGKHPAMVAINAEIRQQEEKIAEEIKKIARSISTQYDIALDREKSLREELEREKNRAKDLTKKSLQFAVLQREVESNKQLYDTLITRVKETSLTSGLNTSNIKIIDRAEVPVNPVKPKKKMNLLLGLVVGLGLGVGLAFFLEYLDDSIESPEDIEKHLGVPFLGPMGYVKNANNGSPNWELFSYYDPKSHVSESVRNIRTNLSFRLKGQGEKSFAVTSTNPSEGKTLFSSNIAILFANMGKKTVFVGTDMRKPRSYKIFGVEKSPGLSDALIGEISFEDAVRKTEISGLSYIPSGTTPPNPAELLTSDKMAELHAYLKENFDIIVYDTPPVMSVTDALIVTQISGNVVVVVESGSTDRKAAKHALRQLAEVEAKILGIVLNEAKVAKDRYYGRYYRYYRRYYKYDYYINEEGEKKRKRKTA
jgi:capsular exopolysaccharide synthesis family protein